MDVYKNSNIHPYEFGFDLKKKNLFIMKKNKKQNNTKYTYYIHINIHI